MGLSSSSINSARSAIAFFNGDDPNLSNNVYISRLFKFFYRERPRTPKYIVFWPVSKLLDLLASWHPSDSLDLKKLTLKTVALIALTSSDRGQTLHALSTDKTHLDDSGISFVVTSHLKNSGKTVKPKVVFCPKFDNPALDVCFYVLEYIKRTKPFRTNSSGGLEEPNQLFLSWASKRPITRPSLARWLKTVLALAGIDTKIFSAHSYRGSSLSSAYNAGASINDIMTAGQWKKASTFERFYNARANNTPVGKLILEQSKDT